MTGAWVTSLLKLGDFKLDELDVTSAKAICCPPAPFAGSIFAGSLEPARSCMLPDDTIVASSFVRCETDGATAGAYGRWG